MLRRRANHGVFHNWFGGYTPCFVDAVLLGAPLLSCALHRISLSAPVRISLPRCQCLPRPLRRGRLPEANIVPFRFPGSAYVTAIVLALVRLSQLRSPRIDKYRLKGTAWALHAIGAATCLAALLLTLFQLQGRIAGATLLPQHGGHRHGMAPFEWTSEETRTHSRTCDIQPPVNNQLVLDVLGAVSAGCMPDAEVGAAARRTAAAAGVRRSIRWRHALLLQDVSSPDDGQVEDCDQHRKLSIGGASVGGVAVTPPLLHIMQALPAGMRRCHQHTTMKFSQALHWRRWRGRCWARCLSRSWWGATRRATRGCAASRQS